MFVSPTRYFQGEIDEVAVFNRALSAGEVANLYAAASAIPEPATTAQIAGALVMLVALIARIWKRDVGART